MKEEIKKILSIADKTYYNYKKENRMIIKLLEKYFDKEDLNEFITTGSIKKLESIESSTFLEEEAALLIKRIKSITPAANELLDRIGQLVLKTTENIADILFYQIENDRFYSDKSMLNGHSATHLKLNILEEFKNVHPYVLEYFFNNSNYLQKNYASILKNRKHKISNKIQLIGLYQIENHKIFENLLFEIHGQNHLIYIKDNEENQGKIKLLIDVVQYEKMPNGKFFLKKITGARPIISQEKYIELSKILLKIDSNYKI